MPRLPTIDGHFWIERDGEIIDWDFPQYSKMRAMWGCGTEKKYLPAPEMTQKIMIAMFKKALSKSFKSDDVFAEFYEFSKSMGLNKVMFNCCFQNCVMELQERGGRLVFGSLGFKRADGSYHYEYGGDNYTTVAHFTK